MKNTKQEWLREIQSREDEIDTVTGEVARVTRLVTVPPSRWIMYVDNAPGYHDSDDIDNNDVANDVSRYGPVPWEEKYVLHTGYVWWFAMEREPIDITNGQLGDGSKFSMHDLDTDRNHYFFDPTIFDREWESVDLAHDAVERNWRVDPNETNSTLVFPLVGVFQLLPKVVRVRIAMMTGNNVIMRLARDVTPRMHGYRGIEGHIGHSGRNPAIWVEGERRSRRKQ